MNITHITLKKPVVQNKELNALLASELAAMIHIGLFYYIQVFFNRWYRGLDIKAYIYIFVCV
jgi:hypothetical protein